MRHVLEAADRGEDLNIRNLFTKLSYAHESSIEALEFTVATLTKKWGLIHKRKVNSRIVYLLPTAKAYSFYRGSAHLPSPSD